MFTWVALLGLASAAVVEKRQFTVTVNDDGIIPATQLPSPTVSSLPTEALPSGFDSAALSSLWAIVEKIIPVETPSISSVVNATNFTVPDTPDLPYSLQDHAPSNMKFPKGFKFGVASAAQQYEGAAKVDGRGPSHWDYLCHREPTQCTNYTSDITDLGYYYYPLDIARIKAMGINTYSFSISWTRIVPFGLAGSPVNEAGLAYYDDLINTLIANGIEPVVTTFHWDDPAYLMIQKGSFLNETIVDDYVYYTSIIFKRFGDRVKTWVTFNEPRVYCSQYQGPPFIDYYPAGLNATFAPYPCTYNLLRAHGSAVKVYRELVKNGTIASGEIAFKNDDNYPVPKNASNNQDVLAALRHFQFFIGIFSQPVYGDGNWPQYVRETIPVEFLPNLTQSDMELIKGSADFYAIDGYRTNIASAPPEGIEQCASNSSNPNFPACQDNSLAGQYATTDGYAIGTPADPSALWLYNSAQLVRRQLKILYENFPSPKIYYSEFGFFRSFEYLFQNSFEVLYDSDRAAYYNDYTTALLYAVNEDKIPVAGFFAWSLVDNFE